MEPEKKKYDLEDRTLEFLKATIRLCKKFSKSEINRRLVGQVIRSVGSVGANYREANESISPKDLKLRIKISRKEAKESHFWFQALLEANPEFENETKMLIQESLEMAKIFTTIMNRV